MHNALITKMRELVDSHVKYYKEDLDYDIKHILDTPEYCTGKFVWVTRVCGTNLVPRYADEFLSGEDAVRYLFGHEKPKAIAIGECENIMNCYEDAVAFFTYDGSEFIQVSREEAYKWLREQYGWAQGTNQHPSRRVS